ncbi:uncharacterized protein A4U43_C08F4520 [Asparagus officinalis]|nr:uncharacterized protein A4U43_C08F4520 [Asparagus officinalis]
MMAFKLMKLTVTSCWYMEQFWHCAKGRDTNLTPILLVAESWVPGQTIWSTLSLSIEPRIHCFRSSGRYSHPGNCSPDAGTITARAPSSPTYRLPSAPPACLSGIPYSMSGPIFGEAGDDDG